MIWSSNRPSHHIGIKTISEYAGSAEFGRKECFRPWIILALSSLSGGSVTRQAVDETYIDCRVRRIMQNFNAAREIERERIFSGWLRWFWRIDSFAGRDQTSSLWSSEDLSELPYSNFLVSLYEEYLFVRTSTWVCGLWFGVIGNEMNASPLGGVQLNWMY